MHLYLNTIASSLGIIYALELIITRENISIENMQVYRFIIIYNRIYYSLLS